MLQHVALETRRDEVEAAVAFWALVGFEQVPVPETLSERAAWLQDDATQIHLLFTEEPTAPPLGHAAVVVDDYDAALERLRAAGFDPEPRAQHWGAPRSYVRAPGGHLVELMAAPPAT
jgi:catechol 2,3-dioxygenase-like lactoylglutathione lyase family enzyme